LVRVATSATGLEQEDQCLEGEKPAAMTTGGKASPICAGVVRNERPED